MAEQDKQKLVVQPYISPKMAAQTWQKQGQVRRNLAPFGIIAAFILGGVLTFFVMNSLAKPSPAVLTEEALVTSEASEAADLSTEPSSALVPEITEMATEMLTAVVEATEPLSPETTPVEATEAATAEVTVSAELATEVVILDTDLDTIPDEQDNCLEIANIDQSNRDLDNLGDACDQTLDLIGMELTGTKTAYIGAVATPLNLSVNYTQGITPAENAQIIIQTTLGSLAKVAEDCPTATGLLQLNQADATSFVYCLAPDASIGPVVLTVFELDATGQYTGRGLSTEISLMRDSLELAFAAAHLNKSDEPTPSELGRCYPDDLTIAGDEIALEQVAIPFTFTLRSALAETNAYAVRFSPSAGDFLIFDANCNLLLAEDRLYTAADELVLNTNQNYSFFLLPPENMTNPNQIEVTVLAFEQSTTLEYRPVVVLEDASANLRSAPIVSGTQVDSLTNSSRVYAIGRSRDNEDWTLVQYDASDPSKEAWLATGIVNVSILGNRDALPER